MEEAAIDKADTAEAHAGALCSDALAKEAQALLRLGRRLLGDSEEARDLVQEVLLKAHQTLPQFRGQSSLRTWLHTIAVRAGLKRLRRRRLSERLVGWFRGASAEVGYGQNPERLVGLAEQSALLARELESLSAHQRTAFALRYFEGLELSEIGALMGIGPGSVKTHLTRAVRRVRAAWQRAGGQRAGGQP